MTTTTPPKAADPSTDTVFANPLARAELYLGAMSIMAAADGAISPIETTMIRSLAATIPELEDAELTRLIPNATTAIRSARQHPEWVRRKAFVLGVEVVTRGNEAVYHPGDANLRGLKMLEDALALPETFTASVQASVRCKYIGGVADDALVATIVDAILYVATASRTSIARLRRVANILEMVPQLVGREMVSLFHVPRLIAGKPLPMLEPSGPDALAERLKTISAFRDKTLSLAYEVSIVLGIDAPTSRALALVEQSLTTTRGLPAQAKECWSAKYAVSE